MDFENMDARSMAEYIRHKKTMDDEWFEIARWIDEFLKSDPPAEEKKMFVPLGCAEQVSMICDGLSRWQAYLCYQCSRVMKDAQTHTCEIYGDGIPSEIWARRDVECPYRIKK